MQSIYGESDATHLDFQPEVLSMYGIDPFKEYMLEISSSDSSDIQGNFDLCILPGKFDHQLTLHRKLRIMKR
ncbi:MAG: hypothetical protein IPO92_18005 [Saprospiraceae bacterium]|nr:hypothetical protein [Saprospiraceae bacterium]